MVGSSPSARKSSDSNKNNITEDWYDDMKLINAFVASNQLSAITLLNNRGMREFAKFNLSKETS